MGGAGTSTLALMFGGLSPSADSVTESWDGTSWTEVANLATAISNQGGAGTQTTAYLLLD